MAQAVPVIVLGRLKRTKCRVRDLILRFRHVNTICHTVTRRPSCAQGLKCVSAPTTAFSCLPPRSASDGELCATELWVVTAKIPRRSSPSSYLALTGNEIHPSIDLPRSKPVSVGALASTLRIECSPIPSHSHSFRTPRRTYPFRSLPHLPRPTTHQSLCTVRYSAYSGDQRFPPTAGAVSTTIKHDMQSDAVAIDAMGMGMPRHNIQPEFMGSGVSWAEAQHPRERSARRRISGYQRKVPLHPYSVLGRG